MKNRTYEPKIHYNYNGKAMCGMKVSKKRLTKKIPEMTCRLCWKCNGLKVNSKEALEIKKIMGNYPYGDLK